MDQLVELAVMSLPTKEHQLLKPKINLPSLKKLYTVNGPYPEELSAPNLESIAGQSYVKVEFPEKIKFILCRCFKTKDLYCNLEHLICQELDTFLPLEQMPRLKRVELLSNHRSRFGIIEDLKRQKEKLKRQDLLIWVSAIKESFTPELADCFREIIFLDSFFFESPLDPFDYFDYNEPLSVFPWAAVLATPHLTRKFPNLERIPENFFNVFIHIRKLRIEGVQVDGENLTRFIKKAKYIEELDVSGIQFKDDFFHEVSRIQTIEYLTLIDLFPLSADYNIDYDIGCLFNLQNIRSMSIETDLIDFKIPAEIFIEFLKRRFVIGTRETYMISSRNKSFYICTKHEFTFQWDGGLNYEMLKFNSMNELISYAEKIALSGIVDTMFV